MKIQGVEALLRRALVDGEPDLARRIFVNRALRMENIHCIGFDLDWTLAPYYRLPVQELIFELSLERLLAHHDYPSASRRAEFRPHFPHRGLIVDRRAGTVLKMDRHRYVGRAYLGRSELDRQERSRLYRQDRLDLSSDRFYWVDTLFELPEVNLFAELVHLNLGGKVQIPDYPQLFRDVRAAVDGVHAEGPLKEMIAADRPRYLPQDPNILLALERMRLGNRKLILLTNSGWTYTDHLCRYLFADRENPERWPELFDLVIVSAGKPDFFRKDRSFVTLDNRGEPGDEVPVPAWGGIYARGSQSGLMSLLDMPGEAVLYVGDHIYGDIVSSKLSSTWRTALILDELEDEIKDQERIAPQIRHLAALKAELSTMGHQLDDLRDILFLANELGDELPSDLRTGIDASHSTLDSLMADHQALRHRAGEIGNANSMTYNPTWGSVFKQGASQSLFGSQVDDFACLYTSRVSNFADYGAQHYFRVLEDPMVHERSPR
jgi:HAD superfamily 5'-nucleotidase-like hydrolase